MAGAGVMAKTVDYLIVGAGITGLSIAWALRRQAPTASILVIDKEATPGVHASGRNSGVLHSGIYYAPDSLKAKYCADGARRLAMLCEEYGLPLARVGKVIVPTQPQDDPTIDLLQERAVRNGAKTMIVDTQQLLELEPCARSATGRALYSPTTAVFDAAAIVGCLRDQLKSDGVMFQFQQPLFQNKQGSNICMVGSDTWEFGHLFNAAGAFADRIAKQFGVGDRYIMLPFKGLYYEMEPSCPIRVNGLVYPVPDLSMPFLGVHTVKRADGVDCLGPSAVPAFGPENYTGFEGVEWGASSKNIDDRSTICVQ